MTSAPSENSDQSGYPPGPVRAFDVRFIVAKDPKVLRADSEYSDRTGRMLSICWAHMSACLFCHAPAPDNMFDLPTENETFVYHVL